MRGDAEEALEMGRHAETESGEQGGESAACDEGHYDEEKDLPRVALGVADEVAEDTAEATIGALHEAMARRALVVG